MYNHNQRHQTHQTTPGNTIQTLQPQHQPPPPIVPAPPPHIQIPLHTEIAHQQHHACHDPDRETPAQIRKGGGGDQCTAEPEELGGGVGEGGGERGEADEGCGGRVGC